MMRMRVVRELQRSYCHLDGLSVVAVDVDPDDSFVKGCVGGLH